MDIIAVLILLIGLVLIIKIMSGKKTSTKTEKLPLRDVVKKTFPKYKVIEKNQTIMICEINHRNELDELVFIRIKPNEAKKIKKSGRILICDYPEIPTSKEMVFDFREHL